MLPIDPSADRARRVWAPCPGCRDHLGCAACREGRACADHWRYLLANKGHLVHLQCPGCGHLWTWDSRLGPAGAARP